MAGVLESLKSAGPIGIVIFLVAFVGNIFNWIAFTTSAWARQFTGTTFSSGIGLWRACGAGEGLPGGCAELDGTNVVYYGAVQAFVSIGFIGLNIMFLIICLKMFTGLCSSVSDIDKVNGIQAIATGVFYLIGIIIFGVEYGDGHKLRKGNEDGDLGYSFILALFAMVIEIICGVIILITSLKGGSVGQSSK